jgi:bla regulator protein BlaR1
MLPIKTVQITTGSAIDSSSSKPPSIQPAGSTPGLWTGWPQVLATLWALGAIGLALRVALATWRVSRTLRRLKRVDADASANAVLRATARELRVRRAPVLLAGDGFFSPALVGCVEPKLIVPRELLEFDRAELRLIFLHELAHLKRRDVAINWAATMLTVLHWLNPVAWLVVWRLRIERELACDELVMSATSETDRRAYGHTIVKLLETFSRGGASDAAQPLPAGGVGILEGGEQMKRRITMIAQFARSNRMWTVLAALIVLALGLVALTDAVKAEPPAPSARQPSLEQPTVRMANGALVTTNDYEGSEQAALRKPATGPTTAEIAQSDAGMRQLLHDLYAFAAAARGAHRGAWPAAPPGCAARRANRVAQAADG